MSCALRPHAEAAGRCACAQRTHTICALSQYAGLWSAGARGGSAGENRAERQAKSDVRSESVRDRLEELEPGTLLPRDGEEAKKQE